jgi:hypothetical protein
MSWNPFNKKDAAAQAGSPDPQSASATGPSGEDLGVSPEALDMSQYPAPESATAGTAVPQE